MNRSLRGATLALLAVSPFAYLACSDDSASTGGTVTTPTVDAATSPVADAAPTEDASPGSTDAGADADAGALTTATVLAVTTHRLPESGVKVVFYDATGTALGTETTDATGQATHTMPAGGSITAVFGTSSQHELVTILGVQPGDTLTALDPLGVTHTTLSVTPPVVANVPLPAGTMHLRVQVGECQSLSFASTGGTADLYPYECEHGSDSPALVLVALNADGAVIGTTATANVSLVSNGTTNVSFAGPWTTPTVTDTSSVTNVTTSGAYGSGSMVVQLTYSSGAGTDEVSHDTSGRPSTGTFMQSFSRQYPGATFVQNEFDFFDEQSVQPYGMATQALVTRGAPGAATIDFGTALPWITTATVTGTTAPSVTWTSSAALTTTKAILAQAYWYDSPSESSGAWFVLAPPTTTTIAPPALPADLAQNGPLATSTYNNPTLVAAVDGTVLASYATARASAALLEPNNSLENGNFSRVVRTLPVDGTLKLTAYGRNSD